MKTVVAHEWKENRHSTSVRKYIRQNTTKINFGSIVLLVWKEIKELYSYAIMLKDIMDQF